MTTRDQLLLSPFGLRDVEAELARRSLLDFTLFTKPDYLAGWFHRLLAERLDQFLQDVMDKKSPRLMIFAPPRHGKSELTSKRFPAYALGRYPDMTFIGTSWGADLASAVNRDIQRVIDSDEYRELFPETTLWGKNIRTVADGSYLRNSDIFEIVNHKGQYKSAGRGGGIAGRGGDILLMDDVVKDAEEASSETIRSATWEWYANDLYTRLMPGAGILFIMTRRHQDDLAGHLLENMRKGGEKWEILNFPAVAEEDEEFRKKGEPLHPERYDLAQLNRIKMGTSDEPGVGSRVWASLYQQRPSAASGDIFLRENWKFLRAPRLVSEMQPEERKLYFRELGIHTVLQRWDTALGGKKRNDMSACVTLGITRSRYYLIDVWADRITAPDAMKQVELQRDRWAATKVVVEGGGSASGKATVQMVKRHTNVAIFEATTATDKVFRADTVSPIHESGLVYMFEGEAWHAKFIDQCANFPNIKFDDDVDAFIGALEEAVAGKKPMNIDPRILTMVGVR